MGLLRELCVAEWGRPLLLYLLYCSVLYIGHNWSFCAFNCILNSFLWMHSSGPTQLVFQTWPINNCRFDWTDNLEFPWVILLPFSSLYLSGAVETHTTTQSSFSKSCSEVRYLIFRSRRGILQEPSYLDSRRKTGREETESAWFLLLPSLWMSSLPSLLCVSQCSRVCMCESVYF